MSVAVQARDDHEDNEFVKSRVKACTEEAFTSSGISFYAFKTLTETLMTR